MNEHTQHSTYGKPARYDVAAGDRQMFLDWCASYRLDPGETTVEDVEKYLTEITGRPRTQTRRRTAAMQARAAAAGGD
jgi:hypothetical protein